MPKGIKGFQKGHPYGKRFKKGNKTWNTGKKLPYIPHPKMKGKIPWNKNKKVLYKPRPSMQGRKVWNKGKHPKYVQGSNNPNWKGGKFKTPEGYIYILQPNHPFTRKMNYIAKSHLVVEKQIGYYLNPKNEVHHLGIKYPIGSMKNKQDNRPQNLMAFINGSAHQRFEKGSTVKPKEIIFDGRKFHH